MRHEGLAQAIAFEQEGQRFYAGAAAKATNPLAARTFASLAVEEIEHRLRLEREREGLDGAGRWEPGFGAGSGLEEAVRDVFFGAGRERLKENLDDADNVRALETAMETERRGLAMYEELLVRSGDEAERAFFQSLRDEESAHLAALENIHRYLTSPGDWFQAEESRAWNWMNT